MLWTQTTFETKGSKPLVSENYVHALLKLKYSDKEPNMSVCVNVSNSQRAIQ